MTKFNVTLWRQVKFSKTVEVEADDEDLAVEKAEEMVEDEDTNDTLESWEAGAWESFAQADVEELEQDDTD